MSFGMNAKVRFLYASILAFTTFVLSAQVINTSMQPLTGVDYMRLSRIDSIINDYVQKDYVNGA